MNPWETPDQKFLRLATRLVTWYIIATLAGAAGIYVFGIVEGVRWLLS